MSTTFAANNDLDTELDTSGFDTSDALPSKGGASCNKPGFYHIFVKDIKAEGNQDPAKGKLATPCRRLDLEILAGSNADQVGKVIYDRTYIKKAVRGKDDSGKEITTGFEDLSEDSRRAMLRKAYGLSLIDENQIGQDKVRIPWSAAPGRQCIVRVDEEEEDDFKDKDAAKAEGRAMKKKTVYRINYGNFWRVDSEEVKDVPKDAEALVMAGGGGPAPDLSDI